MTTKKRFASGFTLIEIVVSIVIIGILAGISIVSYGNWQKSIIAVTLKSDLNGAASAMESAHTFGTNDYPSDITSIKTFTPSTGVTLSGGSTDGGKTYCIDATSSKDATIHYYISSITDNQNVQQGSCVIYTLTTIAGTGGTVSSGGSYNSGTIQTITATPSTNTHSVAGLVTLAVAELQAIPSLWMVINHVLLALLPIG